MPSSEHISEDEVESIFHLVRQIDIADRDAFLDSKCGGRPSLRNRVARLLEIDSETKGPLDIGVRSTPDGTHECELTEKPGSRIGPFELQKKVGEGGFGLVFQALQREPVHRTVAIKIIKPGMDSKAVLGRFRAEQRALERLDHPNIAKILDAGTTDSGRPYFAMELIRGLPINTYCHQKQLDVDDRLALFLEACRGIAHAHQKGLIHRDIKPTNVLVAQNDSRPSVKIIDFGVAKALARPLSDSTALTPLRQLLGTPMYMSPEQADHAQSDVDTRSDVYSLGVLLYELLCGHTPFDPEHFKNSGLVELCRIICEQDPLKPSQRLSTAQSSHSFSSTDRRPNSDHYFATARLQRRLRGDLDWIVMKCLEKEPQRRYQTVFELTRDIVRHLEGEPVEAAAQGYLYRARKFANKHRRILASASLITASLMAGTGVSTWQAIKANRIAASLAIAESNSRNAAEVARRAEIRTRHVLDYVISVFRQTNPNAGGYDVKVADALDQALAKLDRHDGQVWLTDRNSQNSFPKTRLCDFGRYLETRRWDQESGSRRREFQWPTSTIPHSIPHTFCHQTGRAGE